MVKTSTTKGFDGLKEPETHLFAGSGSAGHHTADPAQASLENSQDAIVGQQRIWARGAGLAGSAA
jgi:hypothetical protein